MRTHRGAERMPVVSELLTCFTKIQTKMADGVANDTNQPPKVRHEISNSEDTGCYDCIQLKLELSKVSSELSSLREIIKILQEKESITQQS